MIAVALWVASLPGAVGRMAAFGIGPLLLCTAGPGRALPAARPPLRLIGVVLIGGCGRCGRPHAAARCAGRGRRQRRCGARRRRTARHDQDRQRHVCVPGMAGRRRRCPHARGHDARQRDPVRRGGLHRASSPTARWSPLPGPSKRFEEDCRRAVAGAERARRAARLRGAGDRPAGLAATRARSRCAGSAKASRSPPARPAGHDRPWARAAAQPGDTPEAARTTPARPQRTGRNDRARKIWSRATQYRRNNPTSLPWMRTRLGGRMRTS